jgi:hypothetical protein
MIMKVISFNGVATITNDIPEKEATYQCYSVGTPCYYSTGANNNPIATWIMLTRYLIKVEKLNFILLNLN